jgi:hypothetical protein
MADENSFEVKKIIKTRIISIYGLPWEWKTFFASFLSYFYNRVYSNVDFFQNWKKKNITIKTMLDLETKIKYHDDVWILIIDETGANANSRNSMSERNQFFWRLAMYCRKYNINIVVISQLERMQDVYFREMSYYHFEMHSYFTGPNYLMFDAMIKDRFWNIIANKTFDLIKFSNYFKYTYNTLDKSLIE